MTRENIPNIDQNYAHVVTTPNIANADTPIATLTIPAGRVYRMENKTPLVLKLFTTAGVEISSPSKVYIVWQAPLSKTIYQVGRTISYHTFRRITITEQKKNINTQARRLIEFDDEEIARAERGEVSPITGLTSGYKVMLMLNSPDTVDWTQADCKFNFNMIVLTEQEYLEEKRGRPAV